MAQGASAPPSTTNGVAPTLTANELREILEYERIIQFKDAVLAGTYSRFKIPAHLDPKIPNGSSPNHPTTPANLPPRPTHSTPGSNDSSFYNKSPNTQRSTGSRATMSSEINPILLEKSDDLIKAEIQLQRQRLERALRDQIEQQRILARAAAQTSESLPNFDLTEVLQKALAIVHPSTTAEVEPSIGARSSAASDSFDDNTFYSSQHDTPEPSPPRGQKESGEIGSGLLAGGPSIDHSSKAQDEDQDVVIIGTSLSQNNHLEDLRSQNHSRPSLEHGSSDSNNYHDAAESASEAQRIGKIGRPQYSSTGTSNPVSVDSDDQMADARAIQGQNPNTREDFEIVSVPKVIRNHNLSPVAPQPARVSPLATARDPPILRESLVPQELQSAQLTALRNIPGISSTDSSPKGTKTPKGTKKSEKKKEKKRKGKGKGALASPESPYIKPEPKSPSPFSAAPLPRPQKRQRQSGQYAAELNYDDYRPEQNNQARIAMYSDPRGPPLYEHNGNAYARNRQPSPVYRRVESVNDPYRRVSGGQYARGPESPSVFVTPYAQQENRPLRAASAVIDRRVPEDGRYYREPVLRASVRADADRERSRSPIAMEPPRQAMRIVIDEYGRKYYEPAPAPSMRQSVAPPTRYRDEEVIYERAPIRTLTQRAMEGYEDDGLIVRRGSPALTTPRRVVTQPEYGIPAPPDYRPYRQREYSVRPSAMGPPGEEHLPRREMSHFEGPPREYAPQRAMSVRPGYEMPQQFPSRMQSVHPEAPPREYAASVRPEAYREVVPQAQREYSVRPLESVPRREPVSYAQDVSYYEEVPRRPAQVVVHDDGRYYEEVPARQPMPPPARIHDGYQEVPMARPAQVQYQERPPRAREASVAVYGNDPRMQGYE